MRMLSSATKLDSCRRIDDDPAAREAFADVVVGIAFELERDALGEERAEALAGRAGELEVDRVVRQAVCAPRFDDLVAEDRADVRLVLMIGSSCRTFSPRSSAGSARRDQLRCRATGRGRDPACAVQYDADVSRAAFRPA